MATSGTRTLNLNLDDIIEEAYEQAGLEASNGYDYRTARRSLNLILTDLMNYGVNLWTINLVTTALTSGTSSYTLATTVADVLDLAVRDSDSLDTIANRIGLQEYLRSRTDKSASGTKPVQFAIERNSYGGHTMYVWPVPDNSTHSLVYWTLSYMEDVSATGGEQTIDVPKRFVPAITTGLAYHLLRKQPNLDQQGFARLQLLRTDYQEILTRAQEEDRERSDFIVTPYI